jgi:hypothetical protein
MRRLFFLTLLLCCTALSSNAATGRVLKVLPHFLDLNGKHTLAPSLYDRDAYQAQLRQRTNGISGIRFDVHWKASGKTFAPLLLRVELRGTAHGNLPSRRVLETIIQPGRFSRWTSLPLRGEDFEKFGEVTAWRASLWEGDQLLSEQKSFLW